MGKWVSIKWRPWLILGRISNLPTVWSNCLCGWLLGGGQNGAALAWLLLGASFIYVGGMYWNDAFDADFDRQHRRERPIPSMQVREIMVWRVGGILLAVGALLLMRLGWTTAWLTILLLGSVILYDAIHKMVAFSPVIMAQCRLLLLLVAASTGALGVTGLAVWASIALAGWILGLSYVARRESIRGPLSYWPLLVLALPVVLSLLINDGAVRWRGLFLSALLVVWAVWCLKHTFSKNHRNIGRTVSGLLAGICLVDLLIAPAFGWTIPVFFLLFALSLLAQRYVPAT